MSAEGNPVPPRVDATTEKTKGVPLKKKMRKFMKKKINPKTGESTHWSAISKCKKHGVYHPKGKCPDDK